MKKSDLKRTIDRMVEESIRRILPQVMNEVLLKTIASSGALREAAPAPKPAHPYVPDNGGRRVKVTSPTAPRVRDVSRRPPRPAAPPRGSLREILDVDGAGADFYEAAARGMPPASVIVHEDIPEPPLEEDFDSLDEMGGSPVNQVIAQRIQSLPPELQSLAEGMQIPDDGEMWDDEALDEGFAAVPSDLAPVNNPIRDAARIGVDFSRLRAVAAMTSTPKASREDALANEKFEQLRIKRMREQLDVKPGGG